MAVRKWRKIVFNNIVSSCRWPCLRSFSVENRSSLLGWPLLKEKFVNLLDRGWMLGWEKCFWREKSPLRNCSCCCWFLSEILSSFLIFFFLSLTTRAFMLDRLVLFSFRLLEYDWSFLFICSLHTCSSVRSISGLEGHLSLSLRLG